MKSFKQFLEDSKRTYTGDPLETGGTSIAGGAAPAIKGLFKAGHIKPGDKVLDYGAGKYARNANFLRENGCDVYAYDPFNGTDADGWEGVSSKIPNEKFDVVFTSFVLNVVPEHIEKDITSTCTSLTSGHEFHITRNMDIFSTVKRALLKKDKIVGPFFLNNFADENEKQMYEEGTLTDEIILDFCHHGVQTSRGFQRIPTLEDNGYKLIRKTSGFKVYEK